MSIEIFNEDYRDVLKRYGNKHFQLAIPDPPYFSGPEKRQYYGNEIAALGVKRPEYIPIKDTWEVPEESYFEELYRVSQHQIVWGANYYQHIFPGTGRIVWDKVNGKSSYSDCEIAYCSLHDSVRLVRYMWNGMCQGKSIKEGHLMQGNKKLNQKRIHQCEKPIILYKWLLKEYAQPGWKILDTHGGSLALAIACYEMGYDLVICEKNKTLFKRAMKRYNERTAMPQMFN